MSGLILAVLTRRHCSLTQVQVEFERMEVGSIALALNLPPNRKLRDMDPCMRTAETEVPAISYPIAGNF